MERVSVIGAGVIGMCTAVALQKRGIPVCVIDEREPGTGTSFGNAGLVSIDSCIPIAMPGMLRQVPRWLSDPQGPLSVRPGYLPTAAPWLIRWIRSGASSRRVSDISRALHQLHRGALDAYRSLLGADGFAEIVRATGQLHVWETPEKSPVERLADRLRLENGIVADELRGEAVFDLVPGLSRGVQRAQLYRNNGHVASPYLLVQRLFSLFIANGGEFIRQRVNGLSCEPGGGYRLITTCADLRVKRLVICAGAWAGRLLEGLHLSVPLETERGYHVGFDRDALDLPLPVMHRDGGFGVTPMVDGVRAAGFVEIAGLDAAPDMKREAVLVSQVKRLFPALDVSRKKSFWLGFRPSMPDSLPVLGRLDSLPGLYFGFGHGHTGITGAPSSAEILANLVTGSPNTIDISPYRITRF